MLEKACVIVEATAKKGGGVYPEVLFQVARLWYELYIRVRISFELITKKGCIEDGPSVLELDTVTTKVVDLTTFKVL